MDKKQNSGNVDNMGLEEFSKLKINQTGSNATPTRHLSKQVGIADSKTNDDMNNDLIKWRTDPVDNHNILNKINGDLENSMSSMSASEEDEEEKFNNLVKKKSSKKSDEYDVKSSKMAMSESAKSRRSQFKRSNAAELAPPKKSTFQR